MEYKKYTLTELYQLYYIRSFYWPGPRPKDLDKIKNEISKRKKK